MNIFFFYLINNTTSLNAIPYIFFNQGSVIKLVCRVMKNPLDEIVEILFLKDLEIIQVLKELLSIFDVINLNRNYYADSNVGTVWNYG